MASFMNLFREELFPKKPFNFGPDRGGGGGTLNPKLFGQYF